MSQVLLKLLVVVFAMNVTLPSLWAQEHLTPGPPDAFSIVVIPDTQEYIKRESSSQSPSEETLINPIFEAHVNWIVKNQTKHNVVFVSHVGDIVDKNIPAQWKVAQSCMNQIHGKIPYGISVGNHDMTSQGDSSLFQEYFPASRFSEFSWYGGCYSGSSQGPQISGNNANSYQLFSAGGMDFIFLHLECNAPDDVLDWANTVLEHHSDRKALITCHMGWGPLKKPTVADEFVTAGKGRMTWSKIHGSLGNSPQQIWEKCYRKHKNLIAVFSGDQSRTQAYHATNPGDHGNLVTEILQDYSTGWLRLIRFIPSEQRVEVLTFDPNTEELCTHSKYAPRSDEHQFHFPWK